MTDDEKADMKRNFPAHHFMLIVHPLGSAVVAIPREQDSEEKKAAVSLWHGATVRVSQ